MSRKLALFMEVERLAGLGSWEWVPETDELIWSDNVFRLIGLDPGSAEPSRELFRVRTHPDDRDRQARHSEWIASGARPHSLDNRVVLPSGEVRHLRSILTAVEETAQRPRRVVGFVQDVTDLLEAEAEIRAHLAVAEALTDWVELATGGERLLQGLARALGCVAGGLWVPVGRAITRRSSWTSETADVSAFDAAGADLVYEPGQGLVGRAWLAAEPVHASGLGRDRAFARRELAASAGLQSGIAFPALNGEEVVAVVALASTDDREPSERLLRSLTGIGHELGQFLARRRGTLLPSPLTARESEVLQLAAQDLSGPEIAERLVLSMATVKTHFRNIYAKLGVTERAAAVAKAIREGLID
jgi:PAS domain S-box-containing protein